MNEKDIEYLDNTNTSPGPGAGRSIDPTRPGPADEDVRSETAAYRIKAECFDWDGSFNAERAYHIICAAIAQPDPEPDYERAWSQAQDRIAKLEAAFAQSAEPDAFGHSIPIGSNMQLYGEPMHLLPREHQDPSKWVSRETMEQAHAAQSDAEPVAWQYRWKPTKTTGWTEWHSIPKEELGKYPNPIYETRALYAAPPRPDAEPPGILHNTVGGFKEIATRDTPGIYDNNPQPRLVEEIHDFDRQLIGFRVYDAQPRPLGPNGKPLPGWYYDEDGVCRPYRPDASAGLIEAAEILETDSHYSGSNASRWLQEAANILRARAAERGRK
jgi:hypothetical protein